MIRRAVYLNLCQLMCIYKHFAKAYGQVLSLSPLVYALCARENAEKMNSPLDALCFI